MRFLVLFFVLLFVATPSERAIIDVSRTPAIRPPDANGASFTPPIQAGLGMPPLPAALTLQLVAPNGPNQRQGLADLRIQNVSDHNIDVPISRNGLKTYENCPGHTFLTSAITRETSRTSGATQAGAELYGCAALQGSTITLMPGDWITIAGLPFARSNESLARGAFLYLLTEDRYSSTGGQLRVISRGLYSAGSEATQ